MTHDYPACGRQANAGTGKFARGVQALEGGKQLVGIHHVKPDAVVPHEKNHLAVGARLAAHGDLGVRPRGREFPGIAEQDVQQMQRQPGVGLYRWQRLDPAGHTAFRVLLVE